MKLQLSFAQPKSEEKPEKTGDPTCQCIQQGGQMLKFSSGAMLQQVNSAGLCCLSSDAKLEFQKN
jgi:hypothetical protein